MDKLFYTINTKGEFEFEYEFKFKFAAEGDEILNEHDFVEWSLSNIIQIVNKIFNLVDENLFSKAENIFI